MKIESSKSSKLLTDERAFFACSALRAPLPILSPSGNLVRFSPFSWVAVRLGLRARGTSMPLAVDAMPSAAMSKGV